MSIKVCVPHHASSQKHLLISTLEALLPELYRAREQGLPVTAPPVPASPCWSHGEGSLPPFPCLPHHLQTGTTWDVKPQVPSWLCSIPASPKGHRQERGRALTCLPLCCGQGCSEMSGQLLRLPACRIPHRPQDLGECVACVPPSLWGGHLGRLGRAAPCPQPQSGRELGQELPSPGARARLLQCVVSANNSQQCVDAA